MKRQRAPPPRRQEAAYEGEESEDEEAPVAAPFGKRSRHMLPQQGSSDSEGDSGDSQSDTEGSSSDDEGSEVRAAGWWRRQWRQRAAAAAVRLAYVCTAPDCTQ